MKLFSIDALRGQSKDEVIDFVSVNVANARYTFLNVAKGLVVLGDTDKLKAEFKAKGISQHVLKNARQAVEVWETVVDKGHADEAWFDQMTYQDFVVVNRAVKKLGAEKLAADGLFKARIAVAFGKFELAAESGLTTAEREAAETKAAETKAAETKAKSDADEAAFDKASAESKAESKSETKGKTPLETAQAKLVAAQAAILALIDAGDKQAADDLNARLAGVQMAVANAYKAKFVIDLAPLKKLENQVAVAA